MRLSVFAAFCHVVACRGLLRLGRLTGRIGIVDSAFLAYRLVCRPETKMLISIAIRKSMLC